MHRAGRTARIGASGESLALLAAEDEKNFRVICNVLKKPMDKLEMLDIKYSRLELMRPAVSAAAQAEKIDHRQNAD